MASPAVIAIAMTVSVFISASAQPTSLPTCSRAEEDTQCLIDFISQKIVQLNQFISLKISQEHDFFSEKMSSEAAHVEDKRREMSSPQSLKTPPPTSPTAHAPCDNSKQPRDCKDVQRLGNDESGLYTIYPFLLSDPVEVYCDMDTDGGGWTVFQRRQDGSMNFTRVWNEYREGFGDLEGEHWLGSKYLHALTNYSAHELRIDLGDWHDNRVYAKYGRFHVRSEADGYRLHVEVYSGTAGGDSLCRGGSDHIQCQNGQRFSTIDRDQDMSSGTHCAEKYQRGMVLIEQPDGSTCELQVQGNQINLKQVTKPEDASVKQEEIIEECGEMNITDPSQYITAYDSSALKGLQPAEVNQLGARDTLMAASSIPDFKSANNQQLNVNEILIQNSMATCEGLPTVGNDVRSDPWTPVTVVGHGSTLSVVYASGEHNVMEGAREEENLFIQEHQSYMPRNPQEMCVCVNNMAMP